MSTRALVLFFSPVAYFKGGAERSLLDLVANPGIEPHVLVPGDGTIHEKMNSLGIATSIIDLGDIENVHRPFNFRKGLAAARSTVAAVRSLLRISKRQGIDVVHSNGLKPHVISALARRVGGPPVVVHIRDIPLTGAEKLVWKLLQQSSDRLVLVSKACWPGAHLPRNARVIHNGVDITAITPIAFRPGSPLRIGFIGRIDAAKGLHLLLDWLDEARKAGIKLKLIVRGRFDSSDSGYRNLIEARIQELKLQDHVDIQGFIADPHAVYSDIDVVCVPSHVPDPLPRSVMESMTRGIPVIAYPSGGILDMIEHQQTGFLANTAAEFITATRLILSDERLIARVLSGARNKIATEFAITTTYQKLNDLYDAIAPCPRSPL
jgi:glycosyltransferase involved in cell wall biosynthesis